MNAEEKLERALADDWELHGDHKQLCLILRDEVLRLRALPQAEQKAATWVEPTGQYCVRPGDNPGEWVIGPVQAERTSDTPTRKEKYDKTRRR